MTTLCLTESPEFGRIRKVNDENGEPWFCLVDVCKVLGLKQNGVAMRLDEGLVSTQPFSTRGRTQWVVQRVIKVICH